MNGKQYSRKMPIARLQVWMKFFVLAGLFVFSFSCSQTAKQIFFEKKKLVVPGVILGQESSEQARLSQILECLNQGKLDEAKEIINELSQEKNSSKTASIAAFYRGLINLLEMDGLAGMKDCLKYFETYSEKYPVGPYNKNVAMIVLLLNKYIEHSQKDKGQLKELTHQIERQAQEIETLKYQMQKLEEIQQETERERQLLELN